MKAKKTTAAFDEGWESGCEICLLGNGRQPETVTLKGPPSETRTGKIAAAKNEGC